MDKIKSKYCNLGTFCPYTDCIVHSKTKKINNLCKQIEKLCKSIDTKEKSKRRYFF